MAKTPEGYLLCLAVPITRSGTFIYGEGETPLETGEDGTIEISRTAEDIFEQNCMASFEGKAVTINHPRDFVTPQTWKELAKGHMQNVRPGEEKVMIDGKEESQLLADLLITDHLAIGMVENGLREVSNGYEAEYEQTGEGKGRQTKIRGNHIALVDEGRAGPTCAINDHKGKGIFMSKVAEQLKKLLGKAVDQAVADEEMPEKKKDEKAKDENMSAMDELVKMVKDLGEKVSAMGAEKSKDEEPKKDEPKKDEKKDESKDEEVESSLEDRLKALETAVSKLLEMQSKESESEDEDMDESEDNDFEESMMTGDTKARAEILAPGIKATEKEIKVKALRAAFDTKEGRDVLESLSPEFKKGFPSFDSASKVDTLFIAASEVLKANRGGGLAGSKNSKAFDSDNNGTQAVMTAEKMNEINAARWGQK